MSLLLAQEKQWVVAALPFQVDVKSGNKTSVYNEFEKLIPKRLLDNLVFGNQRYISPGENDYRTLYDLKKKQTSLFLELSGYVKTRDNLVLENLPKKEFKKKISEAEVKIDSCKKRINENQEKIYELTEKNRTSSTTELLVKQKTEGEKFLNLFKNFFAKDVETGFYEKVVMYGTEENPFLELTEELKSEENNLSPDNPVLERLVNEKNVRCLLTGKITVIDEYISVSARLYLYPFASEICSVSDLGTTSDTESLCDRISDNMIRYISGSLPVKIRVKLLNEESINDLKFTFDSEVVNNWNELQTFESGIHTIGFAADGYNSAVTTCMFDGNEVYEIGVNLQKKEEGFVSLKMKYPAEGSFFENGQESPWSDIYKNTSKIEINGKEILGVFVSEDGLSDYFYMDSRKIKPDGFYLTKVKPVDMAKYIDTRRKIAYGSYSAFMISLMGWCVTYGSLYNTYAAYTQNPTMELYEKAVKWQKASRVMTGVAWGTGVLWGYSLVRYLIAADKVLPSETRVLKSEDFEPLEKTKESDIKELGEEKDEQIQ